MRVAHSASAYRDKKMLVLLALGLSFVVHFTTAAMYYFTAFAAGAANPEFWPIVFGSSIQIFATVVSPFTIAGEGIREAAQYVLLHKEIGAAASIVSAALGFWAAEALTLFGGFFWWLRPANYTPGLLPRRRRAGGLRGGGARGRVARDRRGPRAPCRAAARRRAGARRAHRRRGVHGTRRGHHRGSAGRRRRNAGDRARGTRRRSPGALVRPAHLRAAARTRRTRHAVSRSACCRWSAARSAAGRRVWCCSRSASARRC